MSKTIDVIFSIITLNHHRWFGILLECLAVHFSVLCHDFGVF